MADATLMDRAREAAQALQDEGLELMHGGSQDDPRWFTDTEAHAESMVYAFGGEVRSYTVRAHDVRILTDEELDEMDEDMLAAYGEDALFDLMEEEQLDALVLPGWEWDDEITVLTGRYAHIN